MSTGPTRVPISKRLVLINSISGIVTRALTVGVFVWVIQYLMKRVPEQEFELLAIVSAVAMALPLLQTIFTGGLSRYVTEAYARDDLKGVTRVVSSQLPLLAAGSVLVMLLGGFVGWNIHHVLNIPPFLVGEARFMTLLVVARVAIGMVLAPFSTGLFANQRFVLQNLIEIGGSLVRIVLMVWLMLGIGPQARWVVVAQVVSQLFAQLVEAAVSLRLLPALRYHPSSFDWGTCKQVLSFGGWSFVSDAANMIRRTADPPILNIFATPVDVNNFYLGSQCDTQFRELAWRASQPLLPALTAMHAHQQDRRLASAYLRGSRIALWAAMFLTVPLIVFSHDLFMLYLGRTYPEHAEAPVVMVILLMAIPVSYPAVMLSRICFARGDVRPIAVRNIAAQLGNLALTLYLVGWLEWGAIGSATATFVAYALVNLFSYWPLAVRMLDLSWRQFFVESLLPGLLPSVVAACAGFTSAQFIPSVIVRVAVGVPVCLVVYAVAMVLALKPADWADVGRVRQVLWR